MNYPTRVLGNVKSQQVTDDDGDDNNEVKRSTKARALVRIEAGSPIQTALLTGRGLAKLTKGIVCLRLRRGNIAAGIFEAPDDLALYAKDYSQYVAVTNVTYELVDLERMPHESQRELHRDYDQASHRQKVALARCAESCHDPLDQRLAQWLVLLTDKLGLQTYGGTMIRVPLGWKQIARDIGTVRRCVSRITAAWEKEWQNGDDGRGKLFRKMGGKIVIADVDFVRKKQGNLDIFEIVSGPDKRFIGVA